MSGALKFSQAFPGFLEVALEERAHFEALLQTPKEIIAGAAVPHKDGPAVIPEDHASFIRRKEDVQSRQFHEGGIHSVLSEKTGSLLLGEPGIELGHEFHRVSLETTVLKDAILVMGNLPGLAVPRERRRRAPVSGSG